MSDLRAILRDAQTALAAKHAAREAALPNARNAIRLCANAIRATHRGEFAIASERLGEAHHILVAMAATLEGHPDVYYAGFLEDAQKEFAEANVTLAIIQGQAIPAPDEMGIAWPAYLNGLGEAVGELRRHLLDQLRRGDIDRCEPLLAAMDEILGVLTALDFPDAITNNLRRTTDAARGITEKTRGDLTLAVVQTRIAREITRAADRGSHS